MKTNRENIKFNIIKKVVPTMTAITILIGSRGVHANINKFTDIDKDSWYYSSVKELVDRGSISGYEDNTFKPQGQITFAEFLSMSMTAATGKTFPTRPGEHWATGVYREAQNLGIITSKEFPMTQTTLSQPLKREDMAMIVVEINNKLQGGGYINTGGFENQFSDLQQSGFNRRLYILQAYGKKLMTGKPTGFDPKGTSTRAEASMVVANLMGW